MPVVDLVTAFNEAAGPLGHCERATLGYETEDQKPQTVDAAGEPLPKPKVLPPLQWQVLTFYGNDANGAPFALKSERLKGEVDLLEVARNVARTNLNAKPVTEESPNAAQ